MLLVCVDVCVECSLAGVVPKKKGVNAWPGRLGARICPLGGHGEFSQDLPVSVGLFLPLVMLAGRAGTQSHARLSGLEDFGARGRTLSATRRRAFPDLPL